MKFTLRSLRHLALLLPLLFPSQTHAQNLVPNPSFEQTDCALLNTIGIGGNFSTLVKPWFGDAIYLNRCSDDWQTSVPYNKLLISTAENFQEPRTGDAYAAITVFNFPSANYRSYLSVPLLRPLKKGEKCLIRFHVAPYYPAYKPLPYYVNQDVGLLFTNLKVEPNPAVNFDPFLYNTPILKNESGPLFDTAGWTSISRGYIANGQERYLTIGNFRPDDQTKTFTFTGFQMPTPGGWPVSNLMLIDDVTVAPFNPLPDTIFICPSHKPMLDATFFDADVRWNDGSTDRQNDHYLPGILTVTAWLDGWQFIDSARVIETKYAQLLPRDTVKCAEAPPLWLSAAMPGTYAWSTGDTARAIGLEHAGIYQLTVTNGCGEFSAAVNLQTVDCSCKIFAPNVFSPNARADENFQFRPFIDCALVMLESFSLKIFDRYGSLIFETTDKNAAWNGTWRGEPCPNGVYTWAVDYDFPDPFTHEKVQKQAAGDVTLLR